jgi:excisionase family DNA binding protein
MKAELKEILTITEIADLLRCSKTHVQHALEGKLSGLPRMTHLPLGRRKVVRREWLHEWMESNKAS